MNKIHFIILAGVLYLLSTIPQISYAQKDIQNIIYFSTGTVYDYCYSTGNGWDCSIFQGEGASGKEVDCSYKIPIFGVPYGILTVQYFPKTSYYGQDVKASENPEAEWTVRYNGEGMMSEVENSGSNRIAKFKYDSQGILYGYAVYNTLTGETIESDSWTIRGGENFSFEYNGETFRGTCFGQYIDEGNYKATGYVYRRVETKNIYQISSGYNNICYIDASTMRKHFGLFWKNNINTAYCTIERILSKGEIARWNVMRNLKNYSTQLGLPVDWGGPNVRPEELRQAIIGDYIIEYNWR